MGEKKSLHAGIDLDVIEIKDLVPKTPRTSPENLRSDPDDGRIFINSIFKKMKGQQTFLSFSRQISDVNEILTMKYASAGDIARVILKDMALTSQVIKLVNSSLYRHFSKKGIATISEAMIILGTDEVRAVAASLKVYEMMTDMAASQILKDKTLKGLQRSIMARTLALEQKFRKTDALPIAAMIYDLGEYLVALFDPGRYVQVETCMDTQGLTREAASEKVLGVSYSNLGRVMAAKLNLPRGILEAMRPVTRFSLNGRTLTPEKEMQYLCAFIHELSLVPVAGEACQDQVLEVTDKYREILDIDPGKAFFLVENSHEKMLRHAELLNVTAGVPAANGAQTHVKDKTALKEGLRNIKAGLDENLSIHEIFTRIADSMAGSFYFSQVIISIKKKVTQTMEPRYIRGEHSDPGIVTPLGFKIAPAPDIFNRSIERQMDMVVRDIKKESYSKQIPAWFIEKVASPCKLKGFAILPVFVDNKILAMVYVSWAGNAPDISESTIEYLRVFRELMIKTLTYHSK